MSSTTAHTIQGAQAQSWSFSTAAGYSESDSDPDKACDDANAEQKPDGIGSLEQTNQPSSTAIPDEAHKDESTHVQLQTTVSPPHESENDLVVPAAASDVDSANGTHSLAQANIDHNLTTFKDFPDEFFHDDGLQQEDPDKRFPHKKARAKFEARPKAFAQGKSPRRSDDEDDQESRQLKRIRRLEDSTEEYDDDEEGGAHADTPMSVETPGKTLFGGGSNDDGLRGASIAIDPVPTSLFGGGGDMASKHEFQKLSLPSRIKQSGDSNLVEMRDAESAGDDDGPDYPNTSGNASPKEGIQEGMSTFNPEEEEEKEEEDNAIPSDSEENFHHTPRSPSRSSSPSPCPQTNPEPYLLRSNIDRHVPGSFLDADPSGNYNPDAEAKAQKMKAKEARERKKEAAMKAEQRRREAKERKANQRPKLIMRFEMGRCFGTILNFTDGRDNAELFPEDYGVLDSEDEKDEQLRQKRWKKRQQKKIPDPAEEVDDLTGWPEARGCKACRCRGGVEAGVECSAIATGKFPCDECNECDDQDVFCEPIIPPGDVDGKLIKGKCNNCALDTNEDEDNYCSFEQPGLKSHKVCHQCDVAGYDDCVPGLPEDYVAKRIDIERIAYGPDRPCVDCMACRSKGVKCSVKTKRGRGPCKSCKKEGIACWFWELPPDNDKANKGKGKQPQGKGVKVSLESNSGECSTAAAKEKAEEEIRVRMAAYYADLDSTSSDLPTMARSPTPEIEMEDAFGNKGVVTEIHTSFAHPIKFNEDITRSGLECSFCSLPLFGFIGHMEKQVHVLRWHSELGYTELQGGHREDNDQTVMCLACTNTRLQIITCGLQEPHQFALIPGMGPGQAPEFDDAVMLLASADPNQPGEVRMQLERWCSICFSMATVRCCKGQDDMATCAFRHGCGLALCDSCHGRLETEYEGETCNMAAAMDQKSKLVEGQNDVEGTVRADVGFLSEEGLLIKNAQTSGTEKGEEEYGGGSGESQDDGRGFQLEQGYAEQVYSQNPEPVYPTTGESFFKSRYAPENEQGSQNGNTSSYGQYQYKEGDGVDWQ